MIGQIDFESLNIYVSHEPVNMWKSFDGLAVLVQESIGKLPSMGDMFIFYNKKGSKVKILFWDGNGFVIYYKRFERSKFSIERFQDDDGNIQLTIRDLRELLIGATMEHGQLKQWQPFEGKFIM
jgi:transposase